MKKPRTRVLEAALAAATAAFSVATASATELKTQQRILTRTGGTVLRRRARAGPFSAAKGAKIRIGLWRPADSGTQALTVKVRMLDAVTGQVLETVDKALTPGKGHLVTPNPLSDKKAIAVEAEIGAALQTSTECDPKLTYRLSVDVVDGGGRAHESRQVFPCRGGLVRE